MKPPDDAPTPCLPVLEPAVAGLLLRAHSDGSTSVAVSLDLGLSTVAVAVGDDGVRLPEDILVRWDALAHVAAATAHVGGRCFNPTADGDVEEIAVFSAHTDRRCALMATSGAPTLLVAGIQMHRTTGLDPEADTRLKIRAAAPLRGSVLDTTTGLGYTAIHAARTASAVTTIEFDPAVLEVGRRNPWSRPLCTDPKITQLVGDAAELIRELPTGQFDRVIHDPPMFALAGQLYSGDFYRQVHRVLGERGRLFHYIGNPASSSGARVTRGVVRRLHEAGFSRVEPRPEAFGLLAHK